MPYFGESADTVGTYPGAWMGTLVSEDPTPSTVFEDYTWVKVKGDPGKDGLDGLQGEKGDQGIPGKDGTSSYTHIAYANSADGHTDFSVSDSDREYIGMYVDDQLTDSEDPDDPVAAVHRGIHAMAHLIEPLAQKAGLPVRFAATKLIEHDPLIEAKLAIPPEQKVIYDKISAVMEQESGLDAEAALATMRFAFLTRLCRTTVVRPQESREHRRSMQMDRLLTGHYTAIPIFLGIMAFIFLMTFNGIGAWLTSLMELLVSGVRL